MRRVFGFLALLVAIAAVGVWLGWFDEGRGATDGARIAAPRSGGSQPASTPPQPSDTAIVAVTRVIDGDSLELIIDGADVETRLRGVNAPEFFDCGGREARGALTELVESGALVVVGEETDRFGRLLIDLRAGAVDVNAELVARGWALAYHADGRHVAAMEDAAAAGAGFWTLDCDPEFDTRLELGEIVVDPAGNDRDALGDESVEIRNPGDVAVELAGWILRDETTGHRFELPTRTIEAGGSVIVRSGAGSDDDRNHYLDERFPVWSNRGETVILLDPSGTIVDFEFLTGT